MSDTCAGVAADSLSLSDNCVYAVSPQDQCFARHGVTQDCPHGAYWKKLPGLFATISGMWVPFVSNECIFNVI